MAIQCLRRIYKVLLSFSLLFLSRSLSAQNNVWSLKDCINQALQKNIALNQFALSNEVNRVNYEQAKANLYPNLNLGDVHTFNFGTGANRQGDQNRSASGVPANVSYNNLSLNSNVTVYNGLRLNNLIKEYKMTYDAGALDVEKNKNDLLLNVVAAYMQVLFQYDAVEIGRSQVYADTQHVSYTEKYVRVGNMPESNLLQVKAQLATDKALVVAEETQLSLAKLALMQLMEIPYAVDFEVKRPDIKEISPDVTLSSSDIYNIAAGILPDVKSAVLKTHASETALKVSRSEILPRLSVGGSLGSSWYSYNSLTSYNTTTTVQQIGYLQDDPSAVVIGPVSATTASTATYPFLRQFKDNFLPALSVSVAVPIYNNLLYRSDIRRSQISIDIARLNEGAVKNQLRKNIEIAYTDQLAASKNYVATKEQMLSEERAYNDLEKRYKVGMANLIDLLVEKANYTKAEFAHLQAKYVYLFRTKIISFYTGNLLTE
jgi:outer membrane protein